ncbi:sigma 54-interacting transcriptional regulator [Aliidiomarina soli]|uniref:Sigma-54-dependent Fis family transcriptional regulator n=1 Tax=Aliidiomarina soli TaxID=1928574 RepID=A0A432WE69_9GAMM|nr:sigma 54-interacting transcriptional regulator [Aliidiomarina soli]RUO31193.1 sigma-54-dependent Fis family transcriptional regulator [Aliidiomarina soli]
MSNHFDEPTQQFSNRGQAVCKSTRDALLPVAIIACHPDPNRLGEFCALDGLMQFGEQEINRHWPEFHTTTSSIGQGLSVPQVSRKSMRLVREGGLTFILRRQDYSAPVSLNGEVLQDELRIDQQSLEQGVELCLGDHVMLFIKCMPEPAMLQDDLGLVGISQGVQQVRERIGKVASMDEPVLIRGATGTGKELVAQAIRRQSKRFGKPFIVANIPAMQPSLAVSELFGAVKGAFTGASTDRKGYFQAAHQGTLFLDEIGEASQDVQAMLLRALESQQVVPVGSTEADQVNVRVIAATDANLEAQGENEFKQPLLHRLSSYQIFLPPLAERREDIPALLRNFLQGHWLKVEGSDSLPVSFEAPWLSCDLVRQVMQAPWPGNVRQLLNITRQLVVDSRGDQHLQMDPHLLSSLSHSSVTGEAGRVAEPATVKRRKPSQITQDELLKALQNQRYDMQATADELGISRGSVYELIKRHPQLRAVGDIPDSELRQAYQDSGGDLEQMTTRLQVSRIGLLRRLRSMGIDA